MESIGPASDRIRVVRGDLAKAQLGLSPQDYERLAQELGVIFHIGARVDHLRSYKTLQAPNVGSVLAVLELAVHGARKTVHYTSTNSVLGPGERASEISEWGGLPSDHEGRIAKAEKMDG